MKEIDMKLTVIEGGKKETQVVYEPDGYSFVPKKPFFLIEEDEGELVFSNSTENNATKSVTKNVEFQEKVLADEPVQLPQQPKKRKFSLVVDNS